MSAFIFGAAINIYNIAVLYMSIVIIMIMAMLVMVPYFSGSGRFASLLCGGNTSAASNRGVLDRIRSFP